MFEARWRVEFIISVVRSCMDRIGSISDWLQAGVDAAFSYYDQIEECRTELQHFSRIRNLQILQSLPKSEIKSGGYVIESIEASFWCLLTTASYKDCVLKAVNLGHDTDTTAAIAGDWQDYIMDMMRFRKRGSGILSDVIGLRRCVKTA